jgi:hypothetical protein
MGEATTCLHACIPTYLPTYLPALLPTYLLNNCPNALDTLAPSHLHTYLSWAGMLIGAGNAYPGQECWSGQEMPVYIHILLCPELSQPHPWGSMYQWRGARRRCIYIYIYTHWHYICIYMILHWYVYIIGVQLVDSTSLHPSDLYITYIYIYIFIYIYRGNFSSKRTVHQCALLNMNLQGHMHVWIRMYIYIYIWREGRKTP